MENNIPNETGPLAGEAKVKQLIAIRDMYEGETRAQQGRRLLESLRRFPVSTLEARRYLDIMHPAGRVQELRDSEKEIDTLRIVEPSEAGRTHSIALYVLRNEVQQQ